jgi:hypothetical protein
LRIWVGSVADSDQEGSEPGPNVCGLAISFQARVNVPLQTFAVKAFENRIFGALALRRPHQDVLSITFERALNSFPATLHRPIRSHPSLLQGRVENLIPVAGSNRPACR